MLTPVVLSTCFFLSTCQDGTAGGKGSCGPGLSIKTENVAAGSVVAQETSKSKERVQERIEKVRLTALHRPPPTGCILARASTP